MRFARGACTFLAALVGGLVAVTGVTGAALPPSLYQSVQSALDQHVVPAFETFASASTDLASATAILCQAPSVAARQAVDQRFRETVVAWAGIAPLRFGPLARIGRPERIAFWPDPRGIRERQLRPLLSVRDPVLLAPGAIAKQSAAIQGLPALEILLTDRTNKIEGVDDDSRYRCQLANAISGNLAGLARDIVAEWTAAGGWRDKMLRPGSDNDTYREPADAASEIMKSFLTGLQILAEQQVRPRLAAEQKPGKPVIGPFEKSGLRAAYFGSSVGTLTQLFGRANFIAYVPEDDATTKTSIAQAFALLAASDGAGGPADPAQSTTAPSLSDVMERLIRLRRIATENVAKPAGLTIGFNELDGD